MNQQANVAQANAMTGEKTVRTVTFPITGDRELDLISAYLSCGDQIPGLTVHEVNRALRYLLLRSDYAVSKADREAESAKASWQQLQQLGTIPTTPASPWTPWNPQTVTPGYLTSLGSQQASLTPPPPAPTKSPR